jgi:hypothetical protein
LAILTISDGQVNDYFGWSVAMDGDLIVVGAYRESNFKGAVYVYRIFPNKNGDILAISSPAKLTAPNGMNGDQFGWSVAIRGKYIVVGAIGVDDSAGSAHIFENTSNDPNPPKWMESVQFQPDDLSDDDRFGYSVAIITWASF